MQHHPSQHITFCKLLVLQQIAQLLLCFDVVGLVGAFLGAEGGGKLIVAPATDVVVGLEGVSVRWIVITR